MVMRLIPATMLGMTNLNGFQLQNASESQHLTLSLYPTANIAGGYDERTPYPV